MRRHRRGGRHPQLEAGGQGWAGQRDGGHVCVSRGHVTCHADHHRDTDRPGAGDRALLSILKVSYLNLNHSINVIEMMIF